MATITPRCSSLTNAAIHPRMIRRPPGGSLGRGDILSCASGKSQLSRVRVPGCHRSYPVVEHWDDFLAPAWQPSFEHDEHRDP